MPRRDPAWPRAVLLVALAAGGALALQTRDRLDWTGLADPVEVRWARVLAATVVLLGLLSLTRGVLRRLAARRRPRIAAPDGPPGEPVPLLLRLLAALLVLATLAVAWWLAQQAGGPVTATAPPPDPPVDGAVAPEPAGTSWLPLLALVSVLAAAAAAVRLLSGRGRGPAPLAPPAAEPVDAGGLDAAAAAAEGELDNHTDARAAILAAYSAMAASITAGLALDPARLPGAGRAFAADTPTELLERAVGAGLVGRGPAGRLTELFREARFSRHPMGSGQRQDAQRALREVRVELGARWAGRG